MEKNKEMISLNLAKAEFNNDMGVRERFELLTNSELQKLKGGSTLFESSSSSEDPGCSRNTWCSSNVPACPNNAPCDTHGIEVCPCDDFGVCDDFGGCSQNYEGCWDIWINGPNCSAMQT